MDPGVGGITPTSQWRPTQSWWVGDDARSDDGGSNLADSHQVATASNTDRRRSQQAANLDTGTEPDRLQQPYHGVSLADPLCMFGPLPNSSFDGVLDNPAQRELERQGAEVVAQERLSNDPGRRLSVSFADTARLPSDRDGEYGCSGDFWRDQCGRLQTQLASLASEKERWERDRRRLQAEDVGRACDIEGLKRAVEAQSQLVMENLVAAQRLAAMGAVSPPGRGRTANNELLQYAWVPPSATGSRTSAARWGESGDTNPRSNTSSWEVSVSPRAGALTNHVRDEYLPSGGSRGRNLDPTLSRRSTAIVNSAATPERSPTAAVAAGEESPRPDYDPVPFLSYVTSRDPPAATDSGGSPLRRHPRAPAAVSNRDNNSRSRRNEDRVAVTRPTSTEMVLAPRASALARRYTPQLGEAASAHDSRSYHDMPQTGWRRVVSDENQGGRGGLVEDYASGEAAEDEREVWEWNGRRIVVHTAPRLQPPSEGGSEGQASTSEEQGRATPTNLREDERIDTWTSAAVAPSTAAADTGRPHPIVPPSLLNAIEEIRATVQALATGVVGVPALEPLYDEGQEITTGTNGSGLEEGAETAHPVLLQPKPPDATRKQVDSTARRRLSSGTSLARERNGSPAAGIRDDGTRRASRLGGVSGSTQRESSESRSEARFAKVSTGGNEQSGSGSDGSAGIVLPAGGFDENGGDGSGGTAYGRRPTREGNHEINDDRPRKLPPEEEAPGSRGREQGVGRNPVPATDNDPRLSLPAGWDGGQGQQRQKSSSPSGSYSGSSTGAGAPGQAGAGVMSAAGSSAGDGPSPAEDVGGARPENPAGLSDGSNGGVVLQRAVIVSPGTTIGTTAEDQSGEER